MENWKEKVGTAFQKFNSAGWSLLSNFRYAEVQKNESNDSDVNLDTLDVLRNRYQARNIDVNPCCECERELGLLTIEDETEEHERIFFERQKDREEIRRKLAMDSDNEDYVAEKVHQTQDNTPIDRLKGGSNLQICFMNEAAKDSEILDVGQGANQGQEKSQKPVPRIVKRNMLFPPNLPKCVSHSSKIQNNNNNSPQPQVVKRQRPTFFFNRPRSWHAPKVEEKPDLEEDLFTHHRRLQAEAREALAQAKDMARMQMEIERQKKKKSPIADIVGIPFPDGRNLLSRHALLDMNVAQLQVIVNDLHSQIETLNEDLVKFLLERDDLHMEQDSMLVDIEDLTRYLGLKGNSTITPSSDSNIAANFHGSTPNNK